MSRPRTRLALAAALLAAACSEDGGGVLLDTPDPVPANSAEQTAEPVSPVRGIVRDRPPPRPAAGRGGTQAIRRLDGSDNNPGNRRIGAAGTTLRRALPSDYADGRSALAGPDRPNPRAISNAVLAQEDPVPNPDGLSDYLWQWGQFLDHDIDLTDGADPAEPANIPVPAGDMYFDPDATGRSVITFNRSVYADDTGVNGPRQQLNEISAWIDASMVYGADEDRADALRRRDGSGQLLTSPGGLLPFNLAGLANAGGTGANLFLAGDVRANEQTGLAAMHTLFVREHNRRARELALANPDWDGERLYQEARLWVGALVQQVSYQEFLPALLGPGALPPYTGYDPALDAGISNAFSTAAYRLGHSMLSDRILRLDAAGQEHPAGHLALRDAFFRPARLIDEGGIAPVLRGLASQVSQRIDHLLVDEVRNFLFGPPGAGGFDLATLNIQRGRDHGLPAYNAAREALGLPRHATFTAVNPDPAVQTRLAAVYASPDEMDLWVGGLAEPAVPGSQVGPLFQRILVDQFRRLRDGDRFWHERTLDPETLSAVRQTRLSDIIRRNTVIGDELPDDVFRVRR